MGHPTQFSEREKQVIELLIQGKSNKQIALALGVSPRTVEYHLSNIYAKLGVTSRTEAALQLSKMDLRESTGIHLRESTAPATDESGDNVEVSTLTRRMPVKKSFLIGVGLLILTSIFCYLSLYSMVKERSLEAEAPPASTISTTVPSNSTVQGEMQDHMALVLDQVAMSSDRTLLQVSLHFDQAGISVAAPWEITMTDAEGNIYPLTDISPETRDTGLTHIYQTVPLQGNEHLVLKLVSFPSESDLPMLMDLSTHPATVTFDPGLNPQVGQTWTLDEMLQAGPFRVHLVSAQMVSSTALSFTFEPSEDVTAVMLYSELASGAYGGTPVQNASFTANMTFDNMPSVPFEIELRGVYYTAHGPWQVDWQAPAASALNLPTVSPAPSPTPLSIPTLASQDPLLVEVQTLAQTFDQAIVQGPAWVHILYEYKLENLSPEQTYPPPYYQDEQWYEIDAADWVARNLTTHSNAAGNIIQQSVSVGTKGLNFTTGEAFELSPYRLSFDFLTRDLDSALQRGQPVLREETTCDDGSKCLLITIMDSFLQPIQNPDQPHAFHGHGLRVWIHMETGQQVKIQSLWALEDGTEQINYTQRVLSVEKVTAPPKEVLDIIDKVVFPP
jgi:DNA-binding CsgD family transcriptional regulator